MYIICYRVPNDIITNQEWVWANGTTERDRIISDLQRYDKYEIVAVFDFADSSTSD